MTAPVDLWWVDLAKIDSSTELLGPTERRRAARLRDNDGDHRAFIASHIALRVLLGVYLGRDPAALRFDQPAAGKPRVVNAGTLHYSLSRSDSKGLIAVADGPEIAVDLERIRPLPELEAIARDIMTPQVLDRFRRYRGRDRVDRFFAAWTAYEAVSKAEGQALADALPLDWEPERPADGRIVAGRRGRRWWLYPLALPGRYCGHLAAGEAVAIRVLDYPDQLDTTAAGIAATVAEGDIGVGCNAGDRQNKPMGAPR
jgi:4'-phosphopantetheinyl transferase